MGIIKNWQTQVREYFLQKMMGKLDIRRKPVPFDLAKSVGILFDATEPEDREAVKQFAEQLKKKGKGVKTFGFFNHKQDITSFSFKGFNRNDVDWLDRPKSDQAQQFVNETFDVLISVYKGEQLPLEYIAALSKAHLRVGPYTDNTYCYDLMIETSKDHKAKKYLAEVEFFLSRTNNNKHEATAV